MDFLKFIILYYVIDVIDFTNISICELNVSINSLLTIVVYLRELVNRMCYLFIYI